MARVYPLNGNAALLENKTVEFLLRLIDGHALQTG